MVTWLAGGSAAALLVVAVALAARRRVSGAGAPPPRLHWDGARLLTGVGLAGVAFTLASGAMSALPPPLVTLQRVHLEGLNTCYAVVYFALLAYIAAGALEAFGPVSMAELGLTVIVSYGALNGAFFNLLETDSSPLFYGLTVITTLAYLQERPPASGRNPLLLPAVALALAGGLSTWQALYPHASLVRWLALVNWIVVFWLLVAVVRRRSQASRLLASVFLMAGVVALAAVWSTAAAAAQIGAFRVWGLRLRVGAMAPNGVAIMAATYLTLGLGLLSIWRAWWQRALVLLVCGSLLVVLLITSSRTGVVGLGVGLATLALGWAYLRPAHRGPARFFAAAGRRPWRLATVASLGLIGLLVAGLIAFSFWGRHATTDARVLATLSWRTHLWRVALHSVAHRPVLGVGLNNNFNPDFYDVLARADLEPTRPFIAGTHTHNLLLEIAVGLGGVGVAAAVWLGVAAVRRAWRTVRDRGAPASRRCLVVAAGAAGAAWLVSHSLVMALSERSLIADSGWLLLALLVIASRDDGPTGAPDLPPPGLAPRRYLHAGLLCVASLLFVVRPVLATDLRRQAQDALAAGDRPTAARAMARVFRLEPLDAQARAWYGQSCRDAGAATRLQERAIALRPYHAPYFERLGWLHWRRGDLPAALAAFERAAALDRFDVTGTYQASLGYALAAGQKAAALSALRAALVNRSDAIRSPDWQVMDGDLALSPAYTAAAGYGPVEHPATALIESHLGWRAAPPDSLAGPSAISLDEVVSGALVPAEDGARTSRAAIAHLYARWGLFERAESLLAHHDVESTDGQVRFVRATIAFERGAWDQAEVAFEALRESNPRTPLIGYYLGLTYESLGRVPEALAELDRLLQASSAMTHPRELQWSRVGTSFERAGRLESAVEAFRLAQFLAETGGDHARCQLALNRIYLARREPDAVLLGGRQALAALQAGSLSVAAAESILQELATQVAQAYAQAGTSAEAALRQQRQWIDPHTPLGEAFLQRFAERLGR